MSLFLKLLDEGFKAKLVCYLNVIINQPIIGFYLINQLFQVFNILPKYCFCFFQKQKRNWQINVQRLKANGVIILDLWLSVQPLNQMHQSHNLAGRNCSENDTYLSKWYHLIPPTPHAHFQLARLPN